MFSVEWDIKKTVAGLEAMRERLRDLRPAWVSVLQYLIRQTRLQFSSLGGRSGDNWPELSPAYARRKAVVYPGQPILRASDAMFNSLVGETGDSIQVSERLMLTYGTRDRKAQYHQRGGGRLPRRRMLVLTEQDKREVRRLVRLHLANRVT